MKNNKHIFKGESLEQKYSKNFKKGVIPVLISPQILRKRGLGQIDLSYIDPGLDLGFVLEIKSGSFKFDERKVSRSQMRRLYNAADWLSGVFDKSFIVRVLSS